MGQQSKSFFANWFRKKLEQDETTLRNEEESTLASSLPKSILEFTPTQEHQLSDEEKTKYRKYLNLMPPVTIGEINFIAFEAGYISNGYFVRVFIRHARDLEEEFRLGALPLSLYDHEDNLVARGIFNPQDFGTLRFGEARLWTFAWRESDVLKREADLSSFKIRFE